MGTLDVEAEALRASVRSRLFGEVGLPSIGRYQLQRRVGRGGMGVVYAALDPELGRTVALKVLRPHTAGGPTRDGEARLLQEARALARLSHPNVVSVYAIERIEGVVCIAMEYIEGSTLTRWLVEPERTVADVVSAFAEAGRGLAAAHRQGLVHRDFKPPNVMVGTAEDGAARGRVRVLDFGLARADMDLEDTISTEGWSGSDSSPQTETGMVMGTRGYMAPELRDGPATAKSDQYAFFLSLYDAIGQRRDEGERRVQLHTVPRPYRSIVGRGLAHDPADRWPTMDAAVVALERTGGGMRRLGLGAAGVGIAVATGVATMASAEAPGPCEGLVETVERTWSSDRASAVSEALAPSPGYVADAWAKAKPQLDTMVDTLAAEAQRACDAAYDGEALRSAADAQRVLCFETQLLELDALLQEAETRPASAASLPQAIASFDPLRTCGEASSAPRPAAARRLAEALAGVRAQLRMGRYDQADAAIEPLLRDAHVQSDNGVRAEALLLGARTARSAGHIDVAEERLQAALQEASAAGLDRLATQVWIAMVEVTLNEFGRIDEARRMLVPARAALARAGRPPLLEADLQAAEALVAERTAAPERAVELYQSAIATYEANVPASHPRLPTLLHSLARAQRGAGRPEESLEPVERALALSREALGPRHPDVANHLIGIGSAVGFLGDHDRALEAFAEAVDISTEALGPDHPRVAAALHNRGNAYAALRRFDEAYEDLRRATAVDREVMGKDNPGRTQSLYTLAMVQRFRGELADAQALMEEALEIQERAWGEDHPDLSYVVGGLADLAASNQDFDTAAGLFTRARRLLEPALGPTHPRLIYPLLGGGRAEFARGNPEVAATLLEQALTVIASKEHGPTDPMLEVEVVFVMAQALDAAGREPERVRTLLRRARAGCDDAGDGRPDLCGEIEAWSPS